MAVDSLRGVCRFHLAWARPNILKQLNEIGIVGDSCLPLDLRNATNSLHLRLQSFAIYVCCPAPWLAKKCHDQPIEKDPTNMNWGDRACSGHSVLLFNIFCSFTGGEADC